MSNLYSEEALRELAIKSQNLIHLVEEKQRNVCRIVIDHMKELKILYPSFAERANKMITDMENLYEVIEWTESTGDDPTQWYEIVDYNIRNAYGSLFKIFLENL